MSIPSLAQIQPYLTAAAALLGFTTLAFVMKLAAFMRDAAEERHAVLEERLKSTQEDLERTEKWHLREREHLTQEMDRLKNILGSSLGEAGVDLGTLVLGRSLDNAAEAIRGRVEQALAEMKDVLGRIEGLRPDLNDTPDPDWYLELAKGFMAASSWLQASSYFDEYIKLVPTDWEAQFSRAVAYANARGGSVTDLASLRAYNEAIALAPSGLDHNTRARLFSYRGGMLKRLCRLDEAESDLRLAGRLASEAYEKADVRYNLASVYAMRGDRENLMQMVCLLGDSQQALAAIRAHLKDYFAGFADDKEFLQSIGAL